MRSPWLGAVCAVTVLTAGCGGPSDEQQVRDTLGRLQRATATHDYRTLCDKVFSRALIARLGEVNAPCEEVLRRSVLASTTNPAIRVRKVRVAGSTAYALVRTTARGQRPLVTTIQLTREKGSWRVAQLAGPQPPAPASPQREAP